MAETISAPTIAPMATRVTLPFPSRRPARPLTTAPRRGKTMIAQRNEPAADVSNEGIACREGLPSAQGPGKRL